MKRLIIMLEVNDESPNNAMEVALVDNIRHIDLEMFPEAELHRATLEDLRTGEHTNLLKTYKEGV